MEQLVFAGVLERVESQIESLVIVPLEHSTECDRLKTMLELDQIAPKRRVGRCSAGARLTKTS